jgi:hypothetical protein
MPEPERRIQATVMKLFDVTWSPSATASADHPSVAYTLDKPTASWCWVKSCSSNSLIGLGRRGPA